MYPQRRSSGCACVADFVFGRHILVKVRVWDLPTRLFHWALVVCVAGLVITAELGGDAMQWHFRLGYSVLTLVLFRVVWGFAGGYWSRFSSFVPSPGRLLAYVRGNPSESDTSVGHNPLGALSVLGMLAALLAQVTAGLMSDDEILAAGPFVAKAPPEWVSWATFFHTQVGKLVLIGLVILHVLAIAWYRFKKKQNLVLPMLIGDKELSANESASRDDFGSRLFALVVLLACALAVAFLLRLAQP